MNSLFFLMLCVKRRWGTWWCTSKIKKFKNHWFWMNFILLLYYGISVQALLVRWIIPQKGSRSSIKLHNTKIHPTIFNRSSGVESQGHQPKQRGPDFFSPWLHFLAFPGESRHIPRPAKRHSYSSMSSIFPGTSQNFLALEMEGFSHRPNCMVQFVMTWLWGWYFCFE